MKLKRVVKKVKNPGKGFYRSKEILDLYFLVDLGTKEEAARAWEIVNRVLGEALCEVEYEGEIKDGGSISHPRPHLVK